jgi:hypothetical protein
MKIVSRFILILAIGTQTSCNQKIIGLYQHQICKIGPNCFYYEFCSDKTFKYQYWQDILGSGTFTGTWTNVDDTLKLIPNKVFFSKESDIKTSDYTNSTQTFISIKLLRPDKANKSDTLKTNWLISINGNNLFQETNNNGELLIDKQKIDSIKIRDYFLSFSSKPLICIKDSVFKIATDKNEIDIYLAECEYQPAMFEWMTKQFLIRGNKIYPITFEPEQAVLGKKTYYKRIKRSCNNIKLKG